MKIINAQQAKTYNNFKNTKMKLLKVNAAIWFNKVCKTKGLQPTYISLKTNGKTTRNHKTTQYAVKYRINQEIKYLYKKKQHLNQLLYQIQLERANQYNGMWQQALIHMDETQRKIMEKTYQNLYKKIDILTNKMKTTQKQTTQQNNKHINIQPRIINLTHKKLTKEQVKILNLGPQYAVEQRPNKHINEIIIETENAIRQIEPKWQNMYRYQAAKRIKQIKENSKQNPIHKMQYNILRKLKTEMDNENITVMKADKSKAMVVIDKDKQHEKINQFIQDTTNQKRPNHQIL